MTEKNVGHRIGAETRTRPSEVTVSGVVRFEGAQPSRGDVCATRVRLSAVRARVNLDLRSAPVGRDGVFALHAVRPADYLISASLPAETWALKSAVLHGIDLLDDHLRIRPGDDISGLTVTFSDRPTVLSGTLTDALGRPALDYAIVVFSADEAFWTPRSRRTRQARPDSRGTYTMSGLPAGDYCVGAVTGLTPGDTEDPSLFNLLIAASTRIALSEGEQRSLDLRISRCRPTGV